MDKIIKHTYKNVVSSLSKWMEGDEDVKTAQSSSASRLRRKRHYLDPVRSLIHANEKYPYTYISNLKYSEKTYHAFRNAMEIVSATSIDMFVHSITFRAEAINNGFQMLTEQGNYLCAMALIRMQIDNFIMAWAGIECKDRDKFLFYYQNGKPINQLTDRAGHQLTQGYVVKSYADIDPLVQEIYREGNDYIHPSHVVIEQSVNLTSGMQLLSYQDHEVPEEIKYEARRHMLIANNVLCDALTRWVQLKHGELPEPQEQPEA